MTVALDDAKKMDPDSFLIALHFLTSRCTTYWQLPTIKIVWKQVWFLETFSGWENCLSNFLSWENCLLLSNFLTSRNRLSNFLTSRIHGLSRFSLNLTVGNRPQSTSNQQRWLPPIATTILEQENGCHPNVGWVSAEGPPAGWVRSCRSPTGGVSSD